MSIRDLKTIKEKREFIQKQTKNVFEAINIYPEGLEEAQYKNCENMIGAIQIPLGIAGPIAINGLLAKGNYYLPLATTEGALVASVSRGAKAITLAKGANVFYQNNGITRGPVFKTKNLKESFLLKKWILENQKILDIEAQTTSSHIKLLNIFCKIIGKNVYVRFSFDTCDAMGMNMATIATEKICSFIEEKTKCDCLSLAGNFDIDKKTSYLNFILGRGKQVWAEVFLPEKIIKEVLKTTSTKIHEVAQNKNLLGSIMAGAIGANAHHANIIAAMFLSCGQDAAHISEGSIGVTTTELLPNGLYVSVYLPDLIVGTIGGGTYLPSQKEALKILNIKPQEEEKSAFKLAEIIACAVLAGEISLLSSLSQKTLASSHKRLARYKRI